MDVSVAGLPLGRGGAGRIDHFVLGRRLGRGAFATVVAAVDDRNGSEVVLKVPDEPSLADPRVARSWRREVALSARLSHPNVQRSLDDGAGRSRPYLVLEPIPGETLRARLHREGRLPEDVAVDIARQVARGLGHLHSRAVLHRDVKPENIMLTPDGRAVLIDLGLATSSGSRAAWRLELDTAGTPDYMAPEMVAGHRGDERSDLHALGVVLDEMLTGTAPFEAPTPEAVMARVLDETPQAPRGVRPEVSPGLDGVVRRLLRKDPDERYPFADLDARDALDPARFAFGPDRPGARPPSDARLILLHLYVAAAFLVVSALIVLVVVLAGRLG